MICQALVSTKPCSEFGIQHFISKLNDHLGLLKWHFCNIRVKKAFVNIIPTSRVCYDITKTHHMRFPNRRCRYHLVSFVEQNTIWYPFCDDFLSSWYDRWNNKFAHSVVQTIDINDVGSSHITNVSRTVAHASRVPDTVTPWHGSAAELQI